MYEFRRDDRFFETFSQQTLFLCLGGFQSWLFTFIVHYVKNKETKKGLYSSKLANLHETNFIQFDAFEREGKEKKQRFTYFILQR